MNPKHTSNKVEHYTPIPIILAARQVLKVIDLDPASDAFGNDRVEALDYYEAGEGSLEMPWDLSRTGDPSPARVFCNPPGGKLKGKSVAALFWEKLMIERDLGHVEAAIFLAFSVELLQVSQMNSERPCTDFPICFPRKRLSFVDGNGNAAKSNTHASAIIYVPPLHGTPASFVEAFSRFGAIMVPQSVY